MHSEQSIEQFVHSVFSKKAEQKRVEWIACLNNQGYDSTSELEEASQQAWKILSEKLPIFVTDGIKKNLKLKSSPVPIISEPTNNIPSTVKNPEEDRTISSKDLDNIIQFMNLDLPPEKIVKLMDARIGTPRGQAILQRIKLLVQPPKPYPPNKKIPPRHSEDPTLPLFLYESKKIDGRKYYTFLVIGQTGSGKTTLLDAFVNKVTGIEFTDNWRWKLVDESHLNTNQSKESKTSEINFYYINDCLNIFNILIVDTPGFGDTRGLKVDDLITKKFQTFFREIDTIDFILLTIKSSETRELGGSLYVYDRIQQLFGKNAKERFIIMCTFADDKTPKCLEVIKGMICYQKYFQFNNSALYTPSDKSSSMTKSYWKMGMNSIDQFSKYIRTKNVLPLSLNQSSEVLQLRNYLCESIKTSEEQIVQSWKELQISKKNLQQIKINKKKIQENGEYKRKVPKTQVKRSPLGNFYQLCQRCQVTCCQICVWPPGASQSRCTYFNSGQGCPRCPGRCPKSAHIRHNQLVIKETTEIEQIVNYKKQLHDSGLSSAQFYINLLNQNYEKVRSLSLSVWQKSIKIKQDLKKLQSIALKPKIFTNQQFYKKMLLQEKQSKKKGWADRVQILQQIIKKIKFLGDVQKSLTMYDLFPGLEQFEKDYQEVSQGKKSANCSIF